MRGRLLGTYSLLIAVILLKPLSNLVFAGGLKSTAHILAGNPASFLVVMLEPLVAAGILLQVLWLLARMALLSRADLSFVLPATASGYVISALLGKIFLHEQIGPEQWLGILLIFFGSTFAGSTAPKTTGAFHSMKAGEGHG